MKCCSLLLRPVIVTPKAIDIHTCIDVATGAKMLVAGRARKFTIRARSYMAIDTAYEAMLFGTYSPVCGFITLMEDELHMATPHDIRWFHALLALGLRNLGYFWVGNLSTDAQGHDEECQS